MKTGIVAELASIKPLDDIEREHLADARSWVESGAQLYRVEKPATPPKHLVSYFAVVDEDNILLVDHRNARLWLPSGGHVEPGEDPRSTVMRELREELGLDIDRDSVGPPLMVTVTSTVGATPGHIDVSLWYVVRASRDSCIRFDAGEFHSVQWFAFNDVPLQRSDPHLGRFLAKLQRTSVALAPDPAPRYSALRAGS
jgi:8-oxo-dGTP diphosphatase